MCSEIPFLFDWNPGPSKKSILMIAVFLWLQQQITPAGAQFRALQQQQQPQQNLLGVAYSSAADAAKTTFNGYGIQYTF